MRSRRSTLLALLLLAHPFARASADPPPPPDSDEPSTRPAAPVVPAPTTEPAGPDEPAPPPAQKPAPRETIKTLALDLWRRTRISTKWYLGYIHGEAAGERFNKFHVGRGYLTFKFKPVKWFEPRVTIDAHQDDTGDWKVRLKYLHAKFKIPVETAIVTEPYLEFGLAHTPWFDFEEHINRYRMEGTMFIERNGLLNSADVGGTVGALLGRKLPKEYREKVSSKYPGTWGSVALGLYNGGGYHAAETNNDKVFQSRISLRPAGPWLPNLQVSHLLIYGKGNTRFTPDWMLNTFMLSFEAQYFVLSGQVAFGEGNQKGSKVNASSAGDALDHFGFSFFGEAKLPFLMSSLVARVDRFDWDTGGGAPATTRIIAGYAFHFLPHNFALLSLDHLTYDGDAPADWQVKVTLQAAYPL